MGYCYLLLHSPILIFLGNVNYIIIYILSKNNHIPNCPIYDILLYSSVLIPIISHLFTGHVEFFPVYQSLAYVLYSTLCFNLLNQEHINCYQTLHVRSLLLEYKLLERRDYFINKYGTNTSQVLCIAFSIYIFEVSLKQINGP